MNDMQFLSEVIKENPNYEIKYTSLRDASREIDKQVHELRKDIQALRVMREHQKVFELRVQLGYKNYKEAIKQCYQIRNAFMEQCKQRSLTSLKNQYKTPKSSQ